MAADFIQIRGAREHNLKNLNLAIPRNRLTVITGLSGSGKSTLAFDTLYAEGQRRYLESLSSYARQFLEKLKKPEVDQITGLSPAIAIEQRSVAHNPRSTVGTVTEIFDYLRLLFAKAGEVFCYRCGNPLGGEKPSEILAQIKDQFFGQPLQVLAPLVRGRKGEFQKLFQEILKKGYSRVRIDGEMSEIDKKTKLRKTKRHDIEVLIDSFTLRASEEKRLDPALRRSLEWAEGECVVVPVKTPGAQKFFSTRRACPRCRISIPELQPNLFSFNSPYGACPRCKGMGRLSQLLSQGVLRDEAKPIFQGALNEEIFFSFNKYVIEDLVSDLREKYRFDLRLPFQDWPGSAREAFFWGDDDHYGLVDELEDLFHRTKSEVVRHKIGKFLREDVCSECRGARIRKENLGVRIGGRNIVEWCRLSVDEAGRQFSDLAFPESRRKITDPILREIRERLSFLENVGLGYLALDRSVATLAGGELQRIRLAAQIGVGLSGVLYILDEPSIGLHPRDHHRLLDTLEKLRDLKNTVLVVEHDEETIRRADHVVDLGPGAGREGGELVGEGRVPDLSRAPRSLTGKYLTGQLKIPLPASRRDWRKAPCLELTGCAENNLKKINARIPLGLLVCVTGVSGSGKSTLVHDILYKEFHNRLWKTNVRVGRFRSLRGAEQIEQVIEIDQSPIGRTPRSNPATYTDLFGWIRKIFSQTAEARVRNYTPSRFSFNLKGGRCETCGGEGAEKLQMSFMPDLYVVCEVCRGRRYNEPTLEVRYHGKTIAEVLELSVNEALDFFSNFSLLRERLELLKKVGLGYLKLGQSSTTLSGGEAQRIKLVSELSRRSIGRTLYLLDEPTTGLHFADIQNLMTALFELRDSGHTVLVVEHNLEVVKMADFILDLGPEGGEEGGKIVAEGSPEEVAQNPRSYTGQFLKKMLDPSGRLVERAR
ncbi:MAG: excinuclease ABC subunit UvrA [Candidatus Omnitrophica bacterium]|nr:excinuclease ABC subunit UvrA [Candidatus Omnitrophota bacterium]